MRHALLATLAGLVLLGLLLAGWAFWWEPASLRVVEHRVALGERGAALRGLRVAVLTDLHVGSPFNGLERVREVVERTRAARPDLVLICGDLFIQGVRGGRFVPPEEFAPLLGELRPPLGIYAVLGNHDWWVDGPRMARALQAARIPTLENRAVPVEHPAGRIWIAGIGDLWEGKSNIEGALASVDDDAPVLAFTHNPDLFPGIPERVALTVAGHTHGGQVNLPLLGRLIVPSRFGERYAIGHIVEDGRHLFVSPGIGTSILPVRFRVPPEISILVLE